eukprot:COSAG02_NODE_1828_length_10742_cov_3.513013_4_plen_76_part_00
MPFFQSLAWNRVTLLPGVNNYEYANGVHSMQYTYCAYKQGTCHVVGVVVSTMRCLANYSDPSGALRSVPRPLLDR